MFAIVAILVPRQKKEAILTYNFLNYAEKPPRVPKKGS